MGAGRLLVAAALLALVAGVDRSKFRTCNDAAFCRRHRSKTAEPEVGAATAATTRRALTRHQRLAAGC